MSPTLSPFELSCLFSAVSIASLVALQDRQHEESTGWDCLLALASLDQPPRGKSWNCNVVLMPEMRAYVICFLSRKYSSFLSPMVRRRRTSSLST